MKNQEAFLAGYRLLKIPIADENGNPAWPELFPLSRIEKLRETTGPRHFASQMMLEPKSIDRARLDARAIRFYHDEFDARNARLGDVAVTGVAFYWDPSAARRHSDASVCAMVLRDDKNRRAFVHDCLYLAADDDDPHPIATQCGTILEFMKKYELKNIGVEVNGIGNSLPEILRREAAAVGQAVAVQKIVNRESKESRILDAIEPLLGTGRLHAHIRVRDTPLPDEMSDWTPRGFGLDDGLDAVAGALRMQPAPARPAGGAVRPFRARTDFAV
jgi:hypothetical protein